MTALAEAIGERGYPDTTVSHVLEGAGMSRRTFYQLFGNREECFLAAYDHARAEVLAALEQACDPGQPLSERLAGVLSGVLAHLADRPAFARVLVVDPASAGATALERHERTMGALADRLEHLQLDPARLPPRERRLRCEARVGALHRVVQARIVEGRTADLPRLAPELAGIVRRLGTGG